MLKYFYSLCFEYLVSVNGEQVPSDFQIGYFSSLSFVKGKALEFSKLPGFCLHPISCFKTTRVGVRFNQEEVDKENVSIFLLTHEYEKDGFDFVADFGAFADFNEANDQLEKYKVTRRYKPYPNGFEIAECKVNRTIGWTEGFVLFNQS